MDVSYVKSFSQGQITVPKSIRDSLGIGLDFWLKVYIEGSKIVAEPILERKLGKADYLVKLKKMKTDWFDEKEWQRTRKELNERMWK